MHTNPKYQDSNYPSTDELRNFVETTVRDQYNEWPEDTWHSFSDVWDVNIWTGPEDQRFATVYPVVNGNVWSDLGVRLEFTAEWLDDGTNGQDRESYSDDQDRENYTLE